MQQITEIKTALTGKVDRFVCDVVQHTPQRLVVLYRIPKARDVHGVWLPSGTVTVGYFWTDRRYNLYHWLSAEGESLAHYFNIGDVKHLDADVLEWHDLAVDILVTPDGTVQVLDEDELPQDMPPEQRRYVDAARDTVLSELGALLASSNEESGRILRSLEK